MTNPLEPYEGHTVTESTIRVTNAGDGLSAALDIDPAAFELGECVYVVLECYVARVTFEAVKDSPDDRRRVHTFKAETGTVVDELLVRDVVDKQRRRIDESRGVLELELDETGGE